MCFASNNVMTSFLEWQSEDAVVDQITSCRSCHVCFDLVVLSLTHLVHSIVMDTSFFTLFPTPRDSFTFSLSFEGDVPSHLHDVEMVSVRYISNKLSTKKFLDSRWN